MFSQMSPQGLATFRLTLETLVWLGIVVAMWIYSIRFDADLEAYRYGPVAWPRGVLLLMGLFALGHFLVRLREIRREGADEACEVGAAADTEGTHDVVAMLRIVGTFALPLVYLWLQPRMGYFVTTPFFIAAYMVIFREHDWRYLLGTTVGLYVFVLAVFSKLLYVPLPTGNWPFFYDISNALLGFIGSI